MKTALRLLLAVSISGLVISLLVLSRVGGALADLIPPEVLMAFVAIAALVGDAFLDIHREAPRSVSANGPACQIRDDFDPETGHVIPICRPNEDRVAA